MKKFKSTHNGDIKGFPKQIMVFLAFLGVFIHQRVDEMKALNPILPDVSWPLINLRGRNSPI